MSIMTCFLDRGQLGLGHRRDSGSNWIPNHIVSLSDKQIVQFACGAQHVLAVGGMELTVNAIQTYRHTIVDGCVYSWGNNEFGQLGLGHTDDVCTPTCIPGIAGISFVACGAEHSLAMRGLRV